MAIRRKTPGPLLKPCTWLTPSVEALLTVYNDRPITLTTPYVDLARLTASQQGSVGAQLLGVSEGQARGCNPGNQWDLIDKEKVLVKVYADAKMPAQSKQARRTWLSKWIKSKKVYKSPPPLKDSLPVIYWRHGRLLTQQDTILERARLYVRCAIQHKKGVSYTRDPNAPVPAKEKRKPPKDHNGSDEEDRGDEGTQPPKGAKKPRKSRKKNSVFIPDDVADLPAPDGWEAQAGAGTYKAMEVDDKAKPQTSNIDEVKKEVPIKQERISRLEGKEIMCPVPGLKTHHTPQNDPCLAAILRRKLPMEEWPDYLFDDDNSRARAYFCSARGSHKLG
ncbi:hypothetical protein HDK77DRAFT_485582 [Phyllosticta capitalensis]